MVPSTSAAATSSGTWWGSSQHSVRVPSSRARPWTAAAATRARSAAKRSRAPSPTSSQRRPSARCRARCLKLVRASPASSSAPSGAPSRSCATPSSSKTPTAIVSAWVVAGASVVAEACIGRSGYVTSLRHMPKTVILGAARTPIGKLGGGLSTIDATELGATAISAALERAGVAPDEVQHVIMGQVLQAAQGQIPSRQAQIKGGIPKEVSSETVNKVCASGLRSAGMIDQYVRAGDLDGPAVAGGMESMSHAPYLLKDARFGYRMGDAQAIDEMIHDGLTNPFSGKHMAHEASGVAGELGVTRADLDKFALRSHELAVDATDEGRLPEEIVPV